MVKCMSQDKITHQIKIGLKFSARLKLKWDAENIQGIYEGYSFAFDEISYNRFYPIAQLNGYDFGPADFSTDFSNNYGKKLQL
jgi:hypothetical protein